jgi:hypothetical protein
VAAAIACAAGAASPAGPPPSDAIDAALAAYAPVVIGREGWSAKPALPGLKTHKVTGIILHHTGERQNARATIETKMRNLQAFSQRPGRVSATYTKPAWPDVPYHFYVDMHGGIAAGRDPQFAGDTNTGYDPSGFIQVVIEGDFEREEPSRHQVDATRSLLVWLTLRSNLTPDRISTHRDHTQTACPGRNFARVFPTLLEQVREGRRRAVAELCGGADDKSRGAFCAAPRGAPPRQP